MPACAGMTRPDAVLNWRQYHSIPQLLAGEPRALRQRLELGPPLVLFFENNLGENLAGDVFAGTGIAHFELDPVLHHVAQMFERHVARCLGVVEAAVRVFFYDDRTG